MWNWLWEHHKGKVSGVIGGLFLAIVYLFSGFWDMLIVAFIIGIGYLIGEKIDRREPIWQWNDWVDWLTKQWRMFK